MHVKAGAALGQDIILLADFVADAVALSEAQSKNFLSKSRPNKANDDY